MTNSKSKTPKFQVVVLAALAQAEPEADPGYLHGTYYGHRAEVIGVPPYGLPGYSYVHVSNLHKRSAEAEAQSAQTAPAFRPNFFEATAPAAFANVSPLSFDEPPQPEAFSAPVGPFNGLNKREAEAEASPEALYYG